MNNKFDALAKAMAQSVNRRHALKKFGVTLAGIALACFGLASKAKAGTRACLPYGSACTRNTQRCRKLCLGGHPNGPAGYCFY